MGYITKSNLMSYQQELVCIDYITMIAKKTFNIFKPIIVQNNTQIELVIHPVYREPGVMGHYVNQKIYVFTDHILMAAVNSGGVIRHGNIARLQTNMNTIVVNAVIHELFHADQYMTYNILIADDSKIEDATYSITLDFIRRHYDYIVENIGQIDLGELEMQYTTRNMSLYESMDSPYNQNDYERITSQKMIDNVIKYIVSDDIYRWYIDRSPLTKPSIGINLVSDLLMDVIWVKKDNLYDIKAIQFAQESIKPATVLGSIAEYRTGIYENQNSIIIQSILLNTVINPIIKKDN